MTKSTTWKYQKLWLKVEIINSNARKHSNVVAEAKSFDLEVDMLSVFQDYKQKAFKAIKKCEKKKKGPQHEFWNGRQGCEARRKMGIRKLHRTEGYAEI